MEARLEEKRTRKPGLIPQPPPAKVRRPEGLPTFALVGVALLAFSILAMLATAAIVLIALLGGR